MRQSLFPGLLISSFLLLDSVCVAAQDPPAKPYQLIVNNDAEARTVLDPSDPPRLRVDIGRATDAPWKVHLSVPIGSIQANADYTLKVRWRALQTRTVFVVGTINVAPWTGVGLARKFSVGPEWKEESISFKSEGDFPNARVKFDLGTEAVAFEIERMTFVSPGGEEKIVLDARALATAPKPQPSMPPAAPAPGWKLRAEPGTVARVDSINSPADPLRVQVEKVLDLPWQVCVDYAGLAINKGEACEVHLKAKGLPARVAGVGVGLAEKPWSNFGLYKKVELTNELVEIKLAFQATDSSTNARIHLDLGQAVGGMEITQLTFVAGERTTILVGGNAPAPKPAENPPAPTPSPLPEPPKPTSSSSASLTGWSFDVVNPAAARCMIVKSEDAHLIVAVDQIATQDSVRAAWNFQGKGSARLKIKGGEGKSIRCTSVANNKVVKEQYIKLLADWTFVEFGAPEGVASDWSIVVELGNQPGETQISASR